MTALFGFDDVATHANMILDKARVTAFAQAIAEVVRPGDVVADLGTGTGLLAVLAAQAGARRVFAVERGPVAELALEVARDNGVENVVEVMKSDVRDVCFPEPPDVLVSETLGSFGVDEGVLGLAKTAAARCRPGCRIVPSALKVELALADLREHRTELAELESGYSVRLGALARRVRARPSMAHTVVTDLLCVPSTAVSLVVGTDALPSRMATSLYAARSGSANAIVGFFQARLSPTVELASGPGPSSPSWAHVVFPLAPDLPLEEGDRIDVEVRPRLVTDRGTWAWSAQRVRPGCANDIRRGDAMRSLVGGKTELMAQLGLRSLRDVAATTANSSILAAWAAAFGGSVEPVDAMAERLRRAQPERYADDTDARQAVLELLRAAKEPF